MTPSPERRRWTLPAIAGGIVTSLVHFAIIVPLLFIAAGGHSRASAWRLLVVLWPLAAALAPWVTTRRRLWMLVLSAPGWLLFALAVYAHVASDWPLWLVAICGMPPILTTACAWLMPAEPRAFRARRRG